MSACTVKKHERLKRNVSELHRVCTFIGEQRDPGFATLLLFNCCTCGSTLAVPVAT